MGLLALVTLGVAACGGGGGAGPMDDVGETQDIQPDAGAGYDATADGGPDVSRDVSPDDGPDSAPDVPPDVPPDVLPDVLPDSGPDADGDAAGDIEADTMPDAAGDAQADGVGDIEPDVGPDVVPDVGPDVGPVKPTVEPGDLVITELMVNPLVVSDLTGEWIELHNATDEALDLAGCELADDGGEVATWKDASPEATLVPAGAWWVLGPEGAPALNGGVDVRLVYSGMKLSNVKDAVILRCGEVEVDAVRYDAQGDDASPVQAGRSLSLDAAAATAADAAALNDAPDAWCPATATYGDGANRGTPGGPNASCPADDGLVDDCRLVAPVADSVMEFQDVVFAAAVLEAGVTDATPYVDTLPGLTVEVGYGPQGVHPFLGPSAWIWLPAQGPPDWTNAAGDGFDRYEVTAMAPAAGTWAVAARASLDGGATWRLCDVDGIAGGFSMDQAGALTTTADPCQPNPCTVPPAGGCAGDVAVIPAPEGICTVDAATLEPVCDYPAQQVDCAALLGTCEAGACVGVPPAPTEDQVVFTELMLTPQAVAAPAGQWVELANTTDQDLNLAGCALARPDADIEAPLGAPGELVLLPAGGTVVIAGAPVGNGLGAVVPAATWAGTDLSLDAQGGALALRCGDATVDEIAWDAAFFAAGGLDAGGPGLSVQLDPEALDAAANDDGAHWCSGVAPYGGGDMGTPGTPNVPCPVPVPVTRCRLQGPAAVTLDATLSFVAQGRVWVEGVTDVTPGVDPTDALLAQAALGPAGSDPEADATGWTLVDAAAVDGWDDAPDPGWDAYEASVAPAEPGTYDLAFRFSADGGLTWTWCDRDTGAPGEDGSEDGYAPTNAGVVHVDPFDPCDPNPCVTPPTDGCDGDVAQVYAPEGTCTVTGGEAVCAYVPQETDCGALLGTCVDAACQGMAGTPAAGEAFFTEVLAEPVGGGPAGQWFELAASSAVNLDGCRLESGAGSYTVEGPLLVSPDKPVVFAWAAGDGMPADAAGVFYGGVVQGDLGLALAATGDLTLSCPTGGGGAVVVDRASWTSQGAAGRTWSLDPAAYGEVSNDEPSAWCLAPLGDDGVSSGTPGLTNPPCPAVAAPAGCRLQSPPWYLAYPGEGFTAQARLMAPGLTDATDGVDPSPDVLVRLAVGPDGADPTADPTGWTSSETAPVLGWDAAAAGAVGWDAYEGTVTAPDAAGDWDLAARVSVDAGRSWTWCDRDSGAPGGDGAEDGYQPAWAGQVSVYDPCLPNPCTAPPEATCQGDTLHAYAAEGTCARTQGQATCTYEEVSTDCAGEDPAAVCDPSAGACVVPGRPAAGDLVFTEVMAAPTTPEDEWLEVLSVADGPRDLMGCKLADDQGEALVETTWVLWPGDVAVMAQGDLAAALGVPVAFQWGAADPTGALIDLGDAADTVSLRCLDDLGAYVDVDVVAYDATAGFPTGQAGRSMALSEASLTAAENDAGAAWCNPDQATPGGDMGTPGQADPAGCP